MVNQRRLVRYYVVTLVAVVLLYTIAYDIGMTVFEGRPRGFLHSLEVVVQTFTTTGYGQDAPWETAAMTSLVVSMQVVSQVLLFAALPVLVVPLMEEMLTLSAPSEVDGLSDHVVVCGHGTHAEPLVEELREREVDYVVVESDRETADELHETDYTVIHGDPGSTATLRRANVTDARAVVADIDKETNLNVVMAATDVAPEVPAYSVADDPEFADYHRHAGADGVFSPRKLLGRGLANKVRTTVTTDRLGPVRVGEDIELAELPIHPESELRGRTVGETSIDTRTGARLIGAWSSGRFRSPPFPDLRLDEHTAVLAAGRERQIERLQKLAGSTARQYGRGDVVLAGHGVVGSTVREALVADDVPVTVLDVADGPHVDAVGSATDEAALRAAGVADARTVVLALDDDTTTLVATFVVREVAPDVEVIARVDDQENVQKLYRAGADYVLGLATVSGRLLAANVLDEEVISFDKRIEMVRTPTGTLAGQTLEDSAVQERTGCTVVAIEHRDGRVTVNPSEWTELGELEYLVVTGVEDDIARFRDLVEPDADATGADADAGAVAADGDGDGDGDRGTDTGTGADAGR